MQVPTILKGDDSGPIVLVMDEAHDYTGSTLVVAYAGVTRKFTNLTPGGSVSLSFTHEETSRFNIGCKPVLMRLIGPSGAVETVENAALKIKVTDCLGEVNAGGSFVIKPGTQAGSVPVTDLGDIPTTANVGALYAKVNEIIRVLAQRSLLAFAVCLTTIAFATVQTTTLGNLNPSSVVVTNVTESPGSVISDGTNAIDAAGNTYTNGVVSGKLRARNDRIWGEYGYSEPEATVEGVDILEVNFISPGNTQILFSYDNHSWVQYVTYEIDENDWTSLDGVGPEAHNENTDEWSYDFSFSITRQPLFDRFALESQLPGSGSNLDTNTVADIANHAISTNATVSGMLPMTNRTGTAWIGWEGDVLNFSYGISVNQSPSSFASVNGTLFGGVSLQSLLDEKRDVDDNNFSGEFFIGEGDLNIFSPFGAYAHFANIRGHETLDEGWSNITVSTSESIENLPEYLDRNISTNNPAFVTAVLATGLNIDTNDVAVIKAFVDYWPVDPATGATTIGGILAALAAAIALLKKNKLEKGLTDGVPTDANVQELFSESNALFKRGVRYSNSTFAFGSGEKLKDRAINALTFTASSASHTFDLAAALPTATDGFVRDFLVRLVSDAKVTFVTDEMDIRGDGLAMEDGAADMLITLTEVASGVWYVRSIDITATEA